MMGYVLRAIVAVAVVGAAVLLGVWIGDREPPYTPSGGRIAPKSVPVGGKLNVSFYGKHGSRTCPGLVYRQMVYMKTGKIHSYDPIPSVARTQKENPSGEISRILELPGDIGPGPEEESIDVSYRVVTCYVCNPLQYAVWDTIQRIGRICVPAPELRFAVRRPQPSN